VSWERRKTIRACHGNPCDCESTHPSAMCPVFPFRYGSLCRPRISLVTSLFNDGSTPNMVTSPRKTGGRDWFFAVNVLTQRSARSPTTYAAPIRVCFFFS
jgi:hypothetical protein